MSSTNRNQRRAAAKASAKKEKVIIELPTPPFPPVMVHNDEAKPIMIKISGQIQFLIQRADVCFNPSAGESDFKSFADTLLHINNAMRELKQLRIKQNAKAKPKRKR